MKIDGVGGHQTRIESHEPRSAEAELRGQGLQVLARLIARSYLQCNSIKQNLEYNADRQESAPATADKRRGRTINGEKRKAR